MRFNGLGLLGVVGEREKEARKLKRSCGGKRVCDVRETKDRRYLPPVSGQFFQPLDK